MSVISLQNWSSEAISLFLEDWEVERVALSCHLLMDLLCQEMRGMRAREELRVAGFQLGVPGRKEEVLMPGFFLSM